MATRKIKQAQAPEQKEAQAPKVQYDPKKRWQWEPNAKFEFTGVEFHKINEALSGFIVSDMNVPAILKLAEAFGIMQGKLSEYVEKGTIYELQDEA